MPKSIPSLVVVSKSIVPALVVLLHLSSSASATTLYTYTGNTFLAANPSGASSYTPFVDRVTGSFTFADSLAANQVGVDISSLVIDFTLSDGVQTYDTQTVLATSAFHVSTDASGDITAWVVDYAITPFETYITTCSPDGDLMVFPCYLVGAADGGSLVHGDDAITVGPGGAWTRTVVPEPGSALLLLIGLAGLGLRGHMPSTRVSVPGRQCR